MHMKLLCWLMGCLVSLYVANGDLEREPGWVRLPLSYTAMKGDIVVSFDLMNSSQASVLNFHFFVTFKRKNP